MESTTQSAKLVTSTERGSAMEIDVFNASGMDVDVAKLKQRAEFCMRELGLHDETELAVRLVDEAEMTALHVTWMDLPGPTDVLSFPMDELSIPAADETPEPGMLGDIAICPQVAQRQAQESGHHEDEELGLLLTHGILHLLGMDHGTDEERIEMFARQDELRARFSE